MLYNLSCGYFESLFNSVGKSYAVFRRSEDAFFMDIGRFVRPVNIRRSKLYRRAVVRQKCFLHYSLTVSSVSVHRIGSTVRRDDKVIVRKFAVSYKRADKALGSGSGSFVRHYGEFFERHIAVCRGFVFFDLAVFVFCGRDERFFFAVVVYKVRSDVAQNIEIPAAVVAHVEYKSGFAALLHIFKRARHLRSRVPVEFVEFYIRGVLRDSAHAAVEFFTFGNAGIIFASE